MKPLDFLKKLRGIAGKGNLDEKNLSLQIEDIYVVYDEDDECYYASNCAGVATEDMIEQKLLMRQIGFADSTSNELMKLGFKVQPSGSLQREAGGKLIIVEAPGESLSANVWGQCKILVIDAETSKYVRMYAPESKLISALMTLEGIDIC